MTGSAPVRVLICDDSALIRQMLTSMMASDPEIEVLGAAENPFVARQMIKDLNPDVLTLDIEMPGMDGLSFLDKIMTLRPMPVVLISSLTQRGTQHSIRGLELGAFDIVGKPTTDLRTTFNSIREEVIRKVKAAARARIGGRSRVGGPAAAPLAAGVGAPRLRLIALGASTGGVVALKEVISRLPAGCPPVVIAQHMPGAYTGGFARRMDQASALTVKEAEDWEVLKPGHVYLAPGDYHLRVQRTSTNNQLVSRLGDDARVSGHKPSVDVLFQSVADCGIKPVAGAILTGMGADGADGLLAMRKAGAATIGQDEASCTIYGMPRAAYEKGGVIWQVPLDDIARKLTTLCWPPAAGQEREARHG